MFYDILFGHLTTIDREITACCIAIMTVPILISLSLVKSQPEISEEQKNCIKALYDGVVRSLRTTPDSCPRPSVPHSRRSSSQFLRPQISNITSASADKIPLLYLKCRMGTQWEYSSNLTGVYFVVLHDIEGQKCAQYLCLQGLHSCQDPQRSFVRRCPWRCHHLPLQPCHSRIL